MCKDTGLDGLGPNVLKFCKDVIVTSLTSIMSHCIQHGIFPKKLKHACVYPIFKGGSEQNLGHYRPLSVLPRLSKIFERCIDSQLQTHF